MTPDLLVSKNKTNKLYIKLKNPSAINTEIYKNYNNLYNKLCRNSKTLFTKNTYNAHKNDCKTMQGWIFIPRV